MDDQKNPQDILIELYDGIDSHQISRVAQSKLNYFYNANVYGEVTLGGFAQILDRANPQEGEIFYDLGSGAGVPVLIASLMFPFSKCVGVELLPDLHNTAVKIQQRHGDTRISFVNSDFNSFDFSDGDVIFMNSVFFYYEMKDPMFLRNIRNLKKGARIISVETPPISPYLDLVFEGVEEFTWGEAKYQINVRNEILGTAYQK